MKERFERNKGFGVFIIITAFLAVSLYTVSAIGVANSYWDTNPLKLAPGESTTVSLRLQNEGNESATLNVTMDSPIASLVDGNQYIVPPGKVSIPVYIKISIPSNASVGTNYSVSASFKQISSGAGTGFFQVAPGVSSSIPVEVVGTSESSLYGQNPQSNSTWIVFVAIGVLAILAAILLVRKKRKAK